MRYGLTTILSTPKIPHVPQTCGIFLLTGGLFNRRYLSMSCLSSTRRAQLLARLTTKQTQLDQVNTALDSAIGGPEAYKFDTNEGSQWLKDRTYAELMGLIDTLEAQIDSITRKLNGTGVVSMALRRHSRGGCF